MISREISIIVGVAVRACLFLLPKVEKWLMDRPEISTPQSSWIRMKEGMALYDYNIPLYDGDSFHDTPLMLHLFLNLRRISPLLFPLIFVVADVIAALSLHKFSEVYIKDQISEQQKSKMKFAEDSKKVLINVSRTQWVPNLVCMMYMLNPFLIGACVAKTTVVFNNMFLSLLFYHAVKGNSLQATLFLALTTYQTFYPVQLAVPVIFCFYKYSGSSLLSSSLKISLLSIAWSAMLFGASCIESCNSMLATVNFILKVPDLTPNVGVFWYFFMEVFDHFRTFFLFVFQINAVFYSMPLTIKLKTRPLFLMFLLCYIIAIFKSYPSMADAGFCLCLFPLWSHTFKYLRHPLFTGVMLLVTSVLCPIMWHLWIQAGTANANFYFAATMSYSLAHTLICTDILLAYLKYDYHLFEGLKPKLDGSGKEALIRLKN